MNNPNDKVVFPANTADQLRILAKILNTLGEYKVDGIHAATHASVMQGIQFVAESIKSLSVEISDKIEEAVLGSENVNGGN